MPERQYLMELHDVLIGIQTAAAFANGGRRKNPLSVVILQRMYRDIHPFCRFANGHIALQYAFFSMSYLLNPV